MSDAVVPLAVLLLALPVALAAAVVSLWRRHQELGREVARLSAEVRQLAQAGPVRPASAPPPAPLLAAELPPPLPPLPTTAVGPPPGPAAPAATAPAQVPPPVPPPAPPPVPPRAGPVAIDWESLVGVRLFSWVAGVALLVAAVSFLRWSIEHGWLGPAVRAAIGALTGVGLLVGAETRWARRYQVTAQSLAAAGVAILFSTIFAAHALWDLLPMAVTFPLLVLVAAVAMAYAVRRASLTMALLGLAGGFAIPVLLSTGQDRPIGLFSYLLLLNVGLAWVAHQRRWPLLGAVALGLTALYQLGWVVRFLGEANLLVGAVIFLVFPAIGFLALRLSRRGTPAGEAVGRLARWTASLSAVPSALFLLHATSTHALAARWPLLLGFAVVLCAGLLVVAALQGPEWLHLLGAGAAVAAFASLAWSRHLPDDAWPLALLPLLALGAVVLAGPLLLERWGRPFAAEGRLGVYGAPALVALVLMALGPHGERAPGDELIGLAVLLLLTGGTAAVAARTRDGLLLVASAAAALLATLPRSLAGPTPPWPHLATGLLLGAIGLAALLRAERREPGPAAGTWLVAGTAALLVAGQLVAATAGRLDPPLAGALPVQLLLLAGLLLVAARTGRQEVSLVAAGSAFLATAPLCLDRGRAAGLALAVALWAAQLLGAWLRLRRGDPSRLLLWAPVLASALGLVLVRGALHQLHLQVLVGPAALLMAVALVPHLRLLLAAPGGLTGERSRIVVVAGAILGLVTAAIPLQLENEWITVGWALLVPALAALHRRVPHRGLLAWMAGLAAAVTVRLALNEAVLRYHPRSGTPVWNFWLYAYGVPALALLLAARLLGGQDDRPVPGGARLSPALAALGGLLLFLLLNVEIADAFSTGSWVRLQLRGSLAYDLALTIGWACFAVALLVAGLVLRSRPARVAAIALLAVTAVKGFLLDLNRLDGLYRVGSFVGLAVSLAVVAVVLQRFVLAERRPGGDP
jgi:uncharacterized membrane protein